ERVLDALEPGALDRRDARAVDLARGDDARVDRLAVDEHRARAALALAAALLAAGEPEVVAQDVEQPPQRRDAQRVLDAVDDEAQLDLGAAHSASSGCAARKSSIKRSG